MKHHSDKLRQWKEEIASGRTEFNHNHVAPMVNELLELRVKYEKLREALCDAVNEAGFDVVEKKE